MTQQRFTGRRVLVTGTAQGIGRRIAERFIEEGAEVIGLDLLADTVGAPFRQIALDITDAAAVETTCKAIESEWGGLDILVNAAGILRLGDSESLTPADWKACMDVNAAGPFYMLRQWSSTFKRQRRGAIVNVGSNAAVVPRIGMMAYCASKAALVSLSHCAALELAPYGVRCNVVSPGSTDTPMLSGMLSDPAGKERLVAGLPEQFKLGIPLGKIARPDDIADTPMLAGMLSDPSGKDRLVAGLPEQFKLGIPLGKIARPDDIADTVLFLASDQAGHVTMQQIVVDGGATLAA